VSNRNPVHLWMLSVSFLAAAWTTGCSGAKEPVRTAAAPVESDMVILNPDLVPKGNLEFAEVVSAKLPEELQVTGRIGVNENLTSRIGAPVSGRIVKVTAGLGDAVKKGELLAQIASHQVHDARSEYAKAITEMQRRKTELEFARTARDRTAKLYQLKAASLEQVQRAEATLKDAELAIATAQAEINRVAETLRHFGISPESSIGEYTKPAEESEKAGESYEEEELVPVLAPIDGTVMQRMASTGMVVTEANDLFVVSDLSTLWVNAEVPEKNLASIRAGRQVGIVVQAYPGVVFPARISLVGASLNPSTRTVQVRCETRDAQGRLKPEMYANVLIEAGEGQERLVVSAAAVQDMDGQSTIFVREGTDRFRARPVHLGRQVGELVEVLDGLQPGQNVAIRGSFLLKSELLKRRFSVE